MKPFNLEKALAGEYCQTRCGRKVRLLANTAGTEYETEYPLVGVVFMDNKKTWEAWLLNGHVFKSNNPHDNDLIGMWEEKQPQLTITIPAPLKEVEEGREVYCWGFNPTNYSLTSGIQLHNIEFKLGSDIHCYLLGTGQLFKTKEDCQAFLEAMKGARR